MSDSAANPTVLAAASDAVGQMLPWLVGVLGLIIVGGVVMLLVRRLVQQDYQKPSMGFTLQDLRDLHGRGELTDEEFERARLRIIGRRDPAAPVAPPQPRPRTDKERDE